MKIRGIAVHEMVHLIHFDSSSTRRCEIDPARCFSINVKSYAYWLTAIQKGKQCDLTLYASTRHVE